MNQSHALNFKMNQSNISDIDRLPKLDKLDNEKDKNSQMNDVSST